MVSIDNLTDDLCLEYISAYPEVVKHVKNQTRDLCLAAIRALPRSLELVVNQTPELCLEAVRRDGLAPMIDFVRKELRDEVLHYIEQSERSYLQ